MAGEPDQQLGAEFERGNTQALGQPAVQVDTPHRDVFLSHASEDKNSIARPLAKALQSRGISVWFDEYELVYGSSLRQEIDKGIAHSTVGVVILSPSFFAKRWTQQELDGLYARLSGGEDNVIIPIWHEIDVEAVRAHSPLLAGLYAGRSYEGVAALARGVERALARRRAPDAPEQTRAREKDPSTSAELRIALHAVADELRTIRTRCEQALNANHYPHNFHLPAWEFHQYKDIIATYLDPLRHQLGTLYVQTDHLNTLVDNRDLNGSPVPDSDNLPRLLELTMDAFDSIIRGLKGPESEEASAGSAAKPDLALELRELARKLQERQQTVGNRGWTNTANKSVLAIFKQAVDLLAEHGHKREAHDLHMAYRESGDDPHASLAALIEQLYSIADRYSGNLAYDAELALVMVLDHARLVRGDGVVARMDWGCYSTWHKHAYDFVETVFGAAERARFCPHAARQPDTDRLNDEVGALEALLSRRNEWLLAVDRDDLDVAIRRYRSFDAGEQIVLAKVDRVYEAFVSGGDRVDRQVS